ncbi:TPA: hypothetical protein H1012_02885 [archaeon]|nr:hypothetical protein [Candidatus Naiadarchaeales archaeon SRR2090159.bin1288]
MVIRNNRGFLRLIEMALAATLIIAFILFIQGRQSFSLQDPPNYDAVALKTIGQDVLRSLDLRDNDTNGQSDLRQVLNCNDTRAGRLESDIQLRLPPNVGFTLYFANETNTSYRGGYPESSAPLRTDVVAVNYITAGEYGNYSNYDKPCQIKLALWFTQ